MNTSPADQPSSRLSRRLGTTDAVVIGLGSMIGAGVFAALGPAAAAAGGGLLVGLALAAAVAYCNAMSSARLAAVYPESGGTYVYGRRRLGDIWGFIAGWGFVVGKTASCAAMALTFGAYLAPDLARPLAVGAVVGLTAVTLAGVQKTASLTKVVVAIVLGCLAVVIAATSTAELTTQNIGSLTEGGPGGILRSAGFLFFAFAGYARIATLGEEVRDPRRTIPRAIPIALAITLVVYLIVAVVALCAVGPTALATSAAPLETAVAAGRWAWAEPFVRVGATVGSLGVLLSLLAGVSRTSFAMAAGGDLPRWLDAVHPTRAVPHRAELVVAAAVILVVLVADVRAAIGFSSFAVLVYYAIANAAAFTLPATGRGVADAPAGSRESTSRWRSGLRPTLGIVGCVVLAASLPLDSILIGAAVLCVGVVGRAVRSRLRTND